VRSQQVGDAVEPELRPCDVVGFVDPVGEQEEPVAGQQLDGLQSVFTASPCRR
jgi:hypothetical protein